MSIVEDLRKLADQLRNTYRTSDAEVCARAADLLSPKKQAAGPAEACASDDQGWPPRACPSNAWCAGKGVCDRARGKACRP